MNLAKCYSPQKTLQWIFKIAVCIFGISLTCVGVSIFYLLQMGSDPYQVLAVAIHQQLGITHGQANNLLNGMIILVMLLFKRNYIRPSLFLCLLTSGFFVDLFNGLLSNWIGDDMAFGIKLALSVSGCLIMAFGIYLYLAPNLGASPGDSLGLIVCEMCGKPYRMVRIAMDAAYTTAGVLLGGPIGITTVLGVVLTGPFIGVFQRLLEKTPLIKKLTD